jgi:hypothetical protein
VRALVFVAGAEPHLQRPAVRVDGEVVLRRRPSALERVCAG